jgi:hypothetical protein
MKAPQGAFLRPLECKCRGSLAISELPASAKMAMFFAPSGMVAVNWVFEVDHAPVKHAIVAIV